MDFFTFGEMSSDMRKQMQELEFKNEYQDVIDTPGFYAAYFAYMELAMRGDFYATKSVDLQTTNRNQAERIREAIQRKIEFPIFQTDNAPLSVGANGSYHMLAQFDINTSIWG
ncbi:MAG: hypothetical protein E6772_15380 [Dysgonomonas sp.]|nr:hypothetical protein [Dysgonomonas sp.]